MPSAEYFRRQADICIRLSLIASNEGVSNRLIGMAREYMASSEALDKEKGVDPASVDPAAIDPAAIDPASIGPVSMADQSASSNGGADPEPPTFHGPPDASGSSADS
jgi:hypothetical protein